VTDTIEPTAEVLKLPLSFEQRWENQDRLVEVGRSELTVPKHKTELVILDKVVASAPWIAKAQTLAKTGPHSRMHIFDVTAGDGKVGIGETFERNSSPGIHLSKAYGQGLEVTVHLFERAAAVGSELFRNVNAYLLGRQFVHAFDGSAHHWTGKTGIQRDMHVVFHNREFTLDDFTSTVRPGDFGHVLSDPNAAHQTPTVMPSVVRHSVENDMWFTFVNALGCNVGGAKRSPQLRDQWSSLIERVLAGKRRTHDAILASEHITGSQWAYLSLVPDVWAYGLASKIRTFEAVDGRGNRRPFKVSCASDGRVFWEQFDVLTLTRKELHGEDKS
jgi:hypothetical protein